MADVNVFRFQSRVTDGFDGGWNIEQGGVLWFCIKFVVEPLFNNFSEVSSDVNVESEWGLVCCIIEILEEFSSGIISHEPVVRSLVLDECFSSVRPGGEVWFWDGGVNWVVEAHYFVVLVENVVLSSLVVQEEDGCKESVSSEINETVESVDLVRVIIELSPEIWSWIISSVDFEGCTESFFYDVSKKINFYIKFFILISNLYEKNFTIRPSWLFEKKDRKKKD